MLKRLMAAGFPIIAPRISELRRQRHVQLDRILRRRKYGRWLGKSIGSIYC